MLGFGYGKDVGAARHHQHRVEDQCRDAEPGDRGQETGVHIRRAPWTALRRSLAENEAVFRHDHSDCVRGLKQLHALGISHNDLKDEQILVQWDADRWRCWLSDRHSLHYGATYELRQWTTG